MERRSQTTLAQVEVLETAVIVNSSFDSNTAILNEMLNQTHMNSQEEIAQENEQLSENGTDTRAEKQ